MGKKSRKVPTSFSFNLVAGEKLAYPRGSITPKCAYHVIGSPIAMTEELLLAWFLESVEPLIGPRAADELKRLFETDAGKFKSFYEETRLFRERMS